MFYQLNNWLRKKGYEKFSCNLLRKVAETVGDEMDEETRKKVHAGLHHFNCVN